MRIAFTIVYEGLHHLSHKDFAHKMLSMFDYWVVVEGHAKNGGSTSWCNNLNLPVNSTDGTCAFLESLMDESPKLFYLSAKRYWQSKDEQVNMAMSVVRDITAKCFLWQVDVDEHWELKDLKEAEHRLSLSGYSQAEFQFNHYVGMDRVAVGDWGSGFVTRLFKWQGEKFASHEPSILEGHSKTYPIKGIKFDHYSYYFPKDVLFKSKYYKGYDIFDNWLKIQSDESDKIPINKLFPRSNWIGKSNTSLVKLQR